MSTLFSDYPNLQWMNEGSDADWQRALLKSKLLAEGKQLLESYNPSPTDTLLTNPITKSLEAANVNPRFARQTANKFSDTIAMSPIGLPIMGAEGGGLFGQGAANNNYGQMAGGTLLGALGIAPEVKKGAGLLSDLVKQEEGLGMFKSTKPSEIYNKTLANGGYSVNVPTGLIPENGLMMGMYKNTDPRNKVLDKLTKKDIEQQYIDNKKALDQLDNYFGTWHDPESSKTYLDVSKRFEPKDIRGVVKFGEKTGQIAGYNVGKGESFPVGNWNEFIKSPEYAQRLHDLNKTGMDYLSNHPTVNWWDLKNTPLADIYGLNDPEKLNKLAGYLAATSPVSDVPRNARIASEYMRRDIAGEPIIQKDFRMPENSVFETVGNMMPMETGRANNLIAASKGNLNELSKEKVRNMGLALTGDPNAIVLDRHYANLSEKPSENIFTGNQKGVFPSGKPYADLSAIIANQANIAGLTPRDFSANVWTGYRHKAQTEGNVFGQKTAGAGIQGESKSIADTMLDQIKTKAEKLNIPYNEMVKKLKSGEISLLGIMGIPATGLLGNTENKK
jgi:hypothetical protein